MEEEDQSDSKTVELQKMVASLQLKLRAKEDECQQLKNQLKIEKIGVCQFSSDPEMIRLYTGFRNYDEFIEFFLF